MPKTKTTVKSTSRSQKTPAGKIKASKTVTKKKGGVNMKKLEKIGMTIAKDVKSGIKAAKKKYDSLDEDTKKKVIAGAIGVAAVAAGVGAGMAAKKRCCGRHK